MQNLKSLMLVVLLAVLGCGLTACSGDGYNNKEARELVKKAQKDRLKKADYARIIGWYDAACDRFIEQYQKVLKENKNYADFSIALTEMTARFEAEYPHLNMLVNAASSASEDDMGASNYKKFHKIQERFQEKMGKLYEKAPAPDDEKVVAEEVACATDAMASVEEAVEVAAEPEYAYDMDPLAL